MKKILVLTTLILATAYISNAQVAKLSNITELTAGLQIGKTTTLTSFEGGETEGTKQRYKFPAPRIGTSLGVLLADKIYIGPGVSYTFQPRDSKNGYAHQISAFGQTRLSLGKALVRPFFDFKAGYYFASWEQTSKLFDKGWYKWDGFFAEPAFGVSFALSGQTSLSGSIGYQYINAGNRIEQSIMTESGDPIVDATLHEKYHRLLLTIGFTFK